LFHTYLPVDQPTKHTGFGASLYAGTAAGFISAAVPFDRVFLITPGSFPSGKCGGEEKGWECYFEPLSRCTYEDTNAIIAQDPDHLPNKDKNAFRNDTVRVGGPGLKCVSWLEAIQ